MADASGGIGAAMQGFFQSLANDIDNDLMQKRWKGQQSFMADLKERKSPSSYVTQDGAVITNEELGDLSKEDKAQLISRPTWEYNQKMKAARGAADIQVDANVRQKEAELGMAQDQRDQEIQRIRQGWGKLKSSEAWETMSPQEQQVLTLMESMDTDPSSLGPQLLKNLASKNKSNPMKPEFTKQAMELLSGDDEFNEMNSTERFLATHRAARLLQGGMPPQEVQRKLKAMEAMINQFQGIESEEEWKEARENLEEREELEEQIGPEIDAMYDRKFKGTEGTKDNKKSSGSLIERLNQPAPKDSGRRIMVAPNTLLENTPTFEDQGQRSAKEVEYRGQYNTLDSDEARMDFVKMLKKRNVPEESINWITQ